MSEINISRPHYTTLKRARKGAERIAEELGEEFGLDHAWEGNTLNFQRMGVEGHIEVSKKDMILVSGFNVYPNEIEDVLAMHPGVLESAAIGVPDDKTGEVVKIFVVKKDPNLTEASILEHCRANLTGYKVPRQIAFRTELPKTNVGKILRRELRDKKA